MKNSLTSKQYFFTMNMTYYMQALAVFAFGVVVTFLVLSNEAQQAGDNNTWVTIVSIGLISALAMSYFVFRFLIKKIPTNAPLQEKMPLYAKALLIRSALLEMPGLLASIAAYITLNIHFLSVSLLIFVIFLILRPTRNSIAMDLSLSPKEKAMLEDDQAIISVTN